ncbi:hypothetical protein MTR_0177s0080 [Medicago truncatula]|uniref:Uncharacterized protein n=1 Tax=Medicago truncatula TaxID=3880 RepID=A0A072TSE0_MEDTR|nr:hypothetical protein MTR_0177s0080 [Medicago truncatula]
MRYSIGLCIVSLVEMEVANNNEAFSGFNAVVFVGDDMLGTLITWKIQHHFSSFCV